MVSSEPSFTLLAQKRLIKYFSIMNEGRVNQHSVKTYTFISSFHKEVLLASNTATAMCIPLYILVKFTQARSRN